MFVSITILALLMMSHQAEGNNRRRSLYFLDVRSTKNAKFAKDFKITINPGNTSLNIMLDIEQDLNDIYCNSNIFIWYKKQKEFRQFISYDINLCSFLKRAKLNKANMLNAWITNFLKSGNLTRKCPVVKNLYYIVGLKPDKESIPQFAPAGRCRLLTNIYTKQNGYNEAIGNGEFDMELK